MNLVCCRRRWPHLEECAVSKPLFCSSLEECAGVSQAAVVSWHSGGELASTPLSIRRAFYNSGSGRGAIVVVQQAAQALAPLDLACVVQMAHLWTDELVRQALMISLSMIMGDEILHGAPQRLLAEEDEAVQARLP